MTGLTLRCKAWLERDGQTVLGEGLAELLTEIDRCGSLSAASARMGLAYREAWGRVQAAETALGHPLVILRAGGRGGGGTSLTPLGRELLAVFARIQQALQAETNRLERSLLSQSNL